MRILVVEDERPMAGAICRGLEAHGFAVDLVQDGRAALDYAAQARYAAIVLDLMLPGLNGYRVCAELRRRGDTTPVLVLTAKDGEYDEAEALDTGADDYLRKPFSYVVLVARLRALLRRKGGAPPELRVGDLVVDPAARTCQRAGRAVELTPREFGVLETLIRRPGEVVGKTEILDQVWDLQHDGDVNIVEVYVSALRRKIDMPFGVRTIHTVRGVGYRLEDLGA
ncbi:response regulator transcription factor [Actinoplanes sp. NPDC049118]|uniref:response regulator transcription factor n=1 Tax=Actinoplanes sp. NPDC049118 TaxID=3155769 RepID=UPI0033D316C4